jgi:hypothetical protein
MESEYESDASSEPDRFSDPDTEVQLVAEESLHVPESTVDDPVPESTIDDPVPESTIDDPVPESTVDDPASAIEEFVSTTEEPALIVEEPVIEEPTKEIASVPEVEPVTTTELNPVTDYYKPSPGPDDEWRKRIRNCVCAII